jgi:glycosyltransferase involved in cell wall biosynthesis
MKVLVVSGIWPPDVGGPASHGPDVAAFLAARGHDVRAVVAAAAPPAPQLYPLDWVSRRLPKGVVHAVAAAAIARRARDVDVVYTTGMFARTALACAAVRTPYVLKLTGDPAFERARWRGAVGGDVGEFQRSGGAPVLRRLRDVTVRGAAHVICPSTYLQELALTWGAKNVTVLPNPAPAVPQLDRRPHDGVLLAFAGRFGPQKALDVLFGAVARVPDVRLRVAGAGRLDTKLPPNAELLGALTREQVLRLFAEADASVLSSSWENFPHTVVESLAVGTPVIATRVGGVPEVVEDGVNGLLVPPGDVEALAAAIRRFAAEPDLRARLREAAAPSVARFAAEVVYGELEQILQACAR